MAAYCQVYGVIHFVTCGLTACTPGSALGPTLGNEYEKILLYLLHNKNFFKRKASTKLLLLRFLKNLKSIFLNT